MSTNPATITRRRTRTQPAILQNQPAVARLWQVRLLAQVPTRGTTRPACSASLWLAQPLLADLAILKARSPAHRRTRVRRTALKPHHTCYDRKAGLQAVAPLQNQSHGGLTLIRGRFRQRQEFASDGFHRRAPVDGPQVLAATQAQPRRDDGQLLAVEEQL